MNDLAVANSSAERPDEENGLAGNSPVRPDQLIGAGRTADVFAVDEEWVLRRYRHQGADTAEEAAVMAHLARWGYPVPEIRPDSKGPDLVMRRLDGPTLVEAALAGQVTAVQAGAMLAGLLGRLHEAPARLAADPGDRILHLDLHPENVMVTAAGPMVIDWSNTVEGPPELDWAMSALILAQVALDAPAELVQPVRSLLSALLHGRADVASWPLERAGDMRAANPTMSPHEIGLIGEAVALVRASAER
ncbi:phosphotransferase [Streptomyces sp. NBC_01387]|uniref:phosphotransferase n=1 Tax=unclassified Streptomyces TaxID=2593676 RepID=UPI002E33429D|nr:phosphotransferase [Streptomyces sp. NBC_01267]